MKEMTKFHSDDYIEFLNRISPEHTEEISKYQQKFNLGEDCPVWDGLYEFCALSAGGSIGNIFSFSWTASAIKLNRGESDIAINWGGGLHHAKKGEASGFCYVNDINLAILELLRYRPLIYLKLDTINVFFTLILIIIMGTESKKHFTPRIGLWQSLFTSTANIFQALEI